MVRASFEPTPVSPLHGRIHEALGPPTANRISFRTGSWGVRHLSVLPEPIKKLDGWFDVRVVVAPVGSHVRGGGVRSHDAVKPFQIRIEHQGIGRVTSRFRLHCRQSRQRANASLGEHNIAVAFGIVHAALVAEQGRETAGCIEDVSFFLGDPPRVLATAAVIVIATADPIQARGVQYVTPLIEKTAIEAAVRGNFAVTMEFTAHESQLAAIRLHAVGAHAFDRGLLNGIPRVRYRPRYPCRGPHLNREIDWRRRDKGSVKIVVASIDRDGTAGRGRASGSAGLKVAASVRRADHNQFTRPRGYHCRTVVEQVIGVSEIDGPAPRSSVIGGHVFRPYRAEHGPTYGNRAPEREQ